MVERIPGDDEGKTFDMLFVTFCIWSYTLFSRPQDVFAFLGSIRPAFVFGLLCVLVFFAKKNVITETVLIHKQVRLYIAMLLVMISSIIFSFYSKASFVYVFTIYSRVAMFFFVFICVINNIKKLKTLLFILCTGIGIYSLYYLLKGISIENRISFGEMYDPNDVAFVVISFIMFNLIFIKFEELLVVKLFSFVNICVGFALILKTGSRSGFLAVMITSLMAFFSRNKIASMPMKILLLTSALLYVTFSDDDFSRLETIISPQSDYNMTDEEGRVTLWKIGLKNMLTHPVTGIGVDCFPEAVGRDRESRGLSSTRWQTAHNSLVQFGTETGIIGFFLFLTLSVRAFFIFRQVRREARDEKLTMMGEAALLGFSGHFISSMFLSQAYSVYWVFYIGLSVVLSGFLQGELVPPQLPGRFTCQDS